MGISREEFYRRALEAQIRGMMTGEFVGYGSTNMEKARDFEEIEKAFELGYFRKNEEGTPAYGSMDEMLEDLKQGKTALSFPCAELAYGRKGTVSFDMEALNRYYAESGLATSLDTEVDMGGRGDLIKTAQLHELPEPKAPGLFARFTNFLSEIFRGKPTEEMQNYRDQMAEAQARRNTIASMNAAEETYRQQHGALPGTRLDSYAMSVRKIADRVFGKDRNQLEQGESEMTAEDRREYARQLQEEQDRREQELQEAEMKKAAEDREARFQNGTATREDLRELLGQERKEREKLNENAGPDRQKLVDADELEAVLYRYDTADGKNTFAHKDTDIHMEGNQPLSADELLDDDEELTEAESLNRTAFAIKVSRAQRAAFAEGKEVPLNDFSMLKDKDGKDILPDESIYSEMSYQLRRGAKALGLLQDLELPERSPQEQAKFEADEKERIRQEQLQESLRKEEELRQQRANQPDPNEEEIRKMFEIPDEYQDEPSFGDDELISQEAPDVEVPVNAIDDPADQKTDLEIAQENFELSMSAKESNSYNRYRKDIEALRANPNEAVKGLAEDAKEALDHMALTFDNKFTYTKEIAAKDLASLALTHDLATSSKLLERYTASPAAEGYRNKMAKDYDTLVNAGTMTKAIISNLTQKPMAGIHTSLGDNLYQIGKETKSLSLSDMVQSAIPEYQAQVEKQRVEKELAQYPKEQQAFFRQHPIKELKANAGNMLPELSKNENELTSQLRNEAENAKKYLMEKVVFKKDGTKLDPKFEKPYVEAALIKIAEYQSLENVDYATVQMNLSGNPSLSGMYEEMVASQVKASGFADEIANDVTKCAQYVLNPKMNLFDQVEQKNIQAGDKGMTFSKALDEAVENRTQAIDVLRLNIQAWHRDDNMQYLQQQKMNAAAGELKTLQESKETIAEGLEDRKQELQEKEAKIRIEEHVAANVK